MSTNAQSLELPGAIFALVGLAAMLFALERFIPLRHTRASLSRRLLVNVAVSITALVAAMLAVRPAASAMLGWTSSEHIGLLQLASVPPILGAGVAFLLMDLSFYYWHRLNHRAPFLWRFHNAHHIDPDLDVSTAFRFHFGEIVLSAVFRVVQVLIIGPPLVVYAAYELALQATTLVHHSNVRIPIRVERVLGWILVTPRIHGIHHSQVRRENRSNYGVVFPWWDRIHRSLRLDVPQSEVTIGIAGYSLPEDNALPRVLSMPFRRQRDYWTGPDGTRPERAAADPDRSDRSTGRRR
jgi:sterol desaturase/sphingolipid hydroxylase (fatty acid hydroxylase superfamily)